MASNVNQPDYLAYAYAAVVAAGGLMGYVKKGSVMSGVMGLTFGGLMAYGAYQTSQNRNNFWLSMGVSVSRGMPSQRLSYHHFNFVFVFTGFAGGSDGQEVHGVWSSHAGGGGGNTIPHNVFQVRSPDGEKLHRLKIERISVISLVEFVTFFTFNREIHNPLFNF